MDLVTTIKTRFYKEGLKVDDESHAKYLFTVQNDFGEDGVHLNYRDML